MDIVVIGAGPVGATFARLAELRGLNVVLLDAREGASRETRSLALSHGSRVLLERAGAWTTQLCPTEIHTVHTSQRGSFGRVKLTREDAGAPALGYVVGYAALQTALDESLMAAKQHVTFGARVTAITQTANEVNICFTSAGEQQQLTARMVVMADGGANLDKLPQIHISEKDYQQSAMLATVVADRAHQNIAYERFTSTGPLALLPHASSVADAGNAGNEYAMVWVDSHEAIDALMAQTDHEVRAQFQIAFGTRAGQFLALHSRRRYPLKLRQTDSRVVGNVAIIGNAAQAMHPVAGQGFNLGLRDADVLANLLAERSPEDALAAYSKARDADVSRGVGFTDLLASAFLTDSATLRIPRGLALAATDMLPVVRRQLASRMLFGAPR